MVGTGDVSVGHVTANRFLVKLSRSALHALGVQRRVIPLKYDDLSAVFRRKCIRFCEIL